MVGLFTIWVTLITEIKSWNEQELKSTNVSIDSEVLKIIGKYGNLLYMNSLDYNETAVNARNAFRKYLGKYQQNYTWKERNYSTGEFNATVADEIQQAFSEEIVRYPHDTVILPNLEIYSDLRKEPITIKQLLSQDRLTFEDCAGQLGLTMVEYACRAEEALQQGRMGKTRYTPYLELIESAEKRARQQADLLPLPAGDDAEECGVVRRAFGARSV